MFIQTEDRDPFTWEDAEQQLSAIADNELNKIAESIYENSIDVHVGRIYERKWRAKCRDYGK